MTDNKGQGQYDLEYAHCPCFWGREPAKYVSKVRNYISSGTALDLGAGEGKNSIYLAKHGFKVVSVEISAFAVRNFVTRLIDERLIDSFNITIVRGDVREVELGTNYDLVVSYGLFHCMHTVDEIENTIVQMKQRTKSGGFNVVSCFTNKLPIPKVQEYLNGTLLDELAIKNYYSDWHIHDYELDIITEIHPTSHEPHQHSLCRMIAQKPL